MNQESHEHARELLQAARVEGISADGLRWLESHLASCNECSKEANALAAAIESLRVLSVSAPADVVRRTSLAVHRRIELRRVNREPRVLLGMAAAISSAWTLLTTPYTWAFFAWLGQAFRVHDMVWQLGFVVWWFLPGTVLSAIATWRHLATPKAVSNRLVEMDWRAL